jgi:hypothetical protein
LPSFADQKLDHDAIAPLSIKLSVAPVNSDLGKARLFEQCPARNIFREDAACEFVKTVRARGLD